MNLIELKGVGEKTQALFEKLSIRTTNDLVRYYPVHYISYEEPVAIGAAPVGERASVRGIITRKSGLRKTARVTVLTQQISDPSGTLHLIWFNAPYLASTLRTGRHYIFCGRVTERSGKRWMEHPEVFTEEEYALRRSTLLPVYSLTKGLRNATVIRTMKQAFSEGACAPEYLPEGMLRVLGLLPEDEAVRSVHFPTSKESLLKARERIVFDEFFLFILALRTLRADAGIKKSPFVLRSSWEMDRFLDALPFRLTASQRRALGEIESDLTSGQVMKRLLQGDVGSGKTILAFAAMLLCAVNGYQSVLLAPTQVLAAQHYEKLCALIEAQGLPDLSPILLNGSMTASQKRKCKERIASGQANCVIATHAVLQEDVCFRDLALVITDEQHRFGVKQRGFLIDEERTPHMLVMSATPIPRTLGIVYYGDLSVSVLDEKPTDRLPVKNAVVGRNSRDASYRFIRKQLEKGHQAYIICPMVEPNEELECENVTEYAARIRKEFPEYRIDVLHGQMTGEKKEKIMASFASGDTKILVSTTVVEVGVDVPNATVMMIEDAERFGLATLHQLRGRIGRGDAQSYCIFIEGTQREESHERLSFLSRTNDGFEIAEKDFSMRGPGDLLGIRQSGDLFFDLADVSRDRDILAEAGESVSGILSDDPMLLLPEHALLKDRLTGYLVRINGNLIL